MKMKNYKPTESELEILSVLWKNGPSTVRTVNDELSGKKNVGYTTTLKIMQIMVEKGILERSLNGRTHTYVPLVLQEDIQNRLVNKLLETAFGGSAKKLILQALGNHHASNEELDEIKQMIQKMEEDRV